MKTKEELNALKEEYEAVGKKLAALSEDELKEVTGGFIGYTDGFTVDEGDDTIPFDCNGYFFKLSNDVMPVEGEKE